MSSSRNNSTTKSSLNNSSNLNSSSNVKNTSNNSSKTSTGKNYLNNSYFNTEVTNSSGSSSNNRSIVTQINNQYQKNKTVFTVLGVISLVLVIIGVYYYYNYVRGQNVAQVEIKEVIDSVQDAQEEMEISAGEVPISKYSNEYGISMWFKVDGYTYRYGQEKVILKRGDEKYGTPEIILSPRDNKLIVRTRLQHPVEQLSSSRGNYSESFSDIPKEKFAGYVAGSGGMAPLDGDEFKNIEKFAGYVAGSGGMAPLDNNDEFKNIEKFVSNNSAPAESKLYQNNYFDLISGNSLNNVVESFQSTVEDETTPLITSANLEAVMLRFCTDMCQEINVDTINQDAKAEYEYLNTNLNKLIQASNEEIKTIVNNASSSSTETMQNTSESELNVEMFNIFSALIQLEESGEPLNIAQLVSNVNTKLEELDCKFRLVGNNLTTVAGNFVRHMSKIYIDSLYVYYYQLGQIIKDNNPELVSNLDQLPPQVDECVIENLPLQKWVNLVVSQYNQVIDVYLDGQLVSSCVLKGFPEVREEGVVLCPDGGFDGQISRLAFYNTALTQEKAYQIYRAGGSFSGDLVSNIPEWLYGVVGVVVLALIVYAVFM
jgi:hypothetical protein